MLGRLQPGVPVRFPALDSDTSLTPNRAAGESRWFTLALGADKKPMTIVAAVIGGSRAQATAALESMLVPSERALVEETDRARAEASLSAYEDAMAKAMAAATRCADHASDPLASASVVRLRVRTMNRHARASVRSASRRYVRQRR